MKPVRLVVLGIGSVRCAPPIVFALAGYFGERDLEVRLYDEDRERLDLFDALARKAFAFESSKHGLLAFDDAYEALEGADLVVFAIGENCARKFLRKHPAKAKAKDKEKEKAKSKTKPGKSGSASPARDDRGEAIQKAATALARAVPDGAPTLDLMLSVDLPAEPGRTRLDWPAALSEADRRSVPHQVLRWLKGEEGLGRAIEEFRQSPIRGWIDANLPPIREDEY